MSIRAVLSLLATLLALTALAGPARAQDACTPPAQLGLVYVVDDSGSMVNNDPDKLRATAVEIGLRTAPRGSVAAVVAFASSARVLQEPTVLDGTNADTIGQTTRERLNSSGQTDYEAAFDAAKEQLDAMPASVDRKAVVFISDGEPSYRYSSNEAIGAAGIPIFSIGFGEAPPSELTKISTASPGGVASSVQSAGDTQAVVGRILGGLTCQQLLGGQTVEVQPGQVTRIPFDAKPEDANLEVLATWAGPQVTMELERPNLSKLAAGRSRSGETFEQGRTFARATSELPETGRWNVLLTSDSTVPVKVNIDFLGKKFGAATYGPPPLDPSCTAPGATNQVTVVGRQVWSPCIVPSGSGYISRGTTRMNGLDVRPAGDLRIDGSGAVSGAGTIGFTVDKRFPSLDGFLPVPGIAPNAINLARGFRLPAEIPNFVGIPFLKSAGVEIGWTRDGLVMKAALKFDGVTPIGDAAQSITPKGKLIPGFGVASEFKASNTTGLIADRIEASANKIAVFGPVELNAVRFTLRPIAQTVGGGGTLAFGSVANRAAGLAPKLSADFEWSMREKKLSSLKVEADQINRPVFHPALFLRRVTLEGADGRTLTPPIATPKFSGGGALTLGPTVDLGPLGKRNIIEADGKLDIFYPDKVTLSSGVTLLTLVSLAEGGLTVDIPDLKGSVWGRIGFMLPVGLGYEGSTEGSITLSPFAFEAVGRGTVKTPLGSNGGQGVVTQNGVGACAELRLNLPFGGSITKKVGGSVRLSELASSAASLAKSLLNGCDFAQVRRALKSQAPGTVSVRLLRGRARLVYLPTAAGQDIEITRPGLDPVLVPAGATTPVSASGLLAGRDADGGLYLVLASNKNGFAQVRTTSGAPLTGVQTADALPSPRGRGRVVRGAGGTRVLTYRLSGLTRGDRVRIVEGGQQAGRTVLRARAPRRGRVRFRPATGTGRRIITAIVERNGNLRATVRLATYRATVALPTPRRLKVQRTKASAIVRWAAPARGKPQYRIDLLLADGRRFASTTGRTRFVLRDLPPKARGTVLVRALYPDGKVSWPAKAKLRSR